MNPRELDQVRQAAAEGLALVNQQASPPDAMRAGTQQLKQVNAVRDGIPNQNSSPLTCWTAARQAAITAW